MTLEVDRPSWFVAMMTFRSIGGKLRQIYSLGLLLLVIARISLISGQQGTRLFLPHVDTRVCMIYFNISMLQRDRESGYMTSFLFHAMQLVSLWYIS